MIIYEEGMINDLPHLRSYMRDIGATGSMGREVEEDEKFCNNNDWNKQEEREWAVRNATYKERVFFIGTTISWFRFHFFHYESCGLKYGWAAQVKFYGSSKENMVNTKIRNNCR